jgi:Mg/Co/Ni transporter MgtE
VCKKPFHSIPVVNMAGKLIGVIPKNFVIVLIEHHAWYEYKDIEGTKAIALYRTAT